MTARVVDDHYRLQAADLGRSPLPLRVQITNVTYQGLERVSVLLHFDQTGKPLLLEERQMQRLIREFGGDFGKWVGKSVELSLIADGDPPEQTVLIDVRTDGAAAEEEPTEESTVAATLVENSGRETLRQDEEGSNPQGNSFAASVRLIAILALISILVYLFGQSEALRAFFGF